jgi:multiple sugar transport system substrate-binding protein
MKPLEFRRIFLFLPAAMLAATSGCSKSSTPSGPSISVAINAGVEGDGIKAAAKRYEALKHVKIEISELPYNNLYSKILLSVSNPTSPFDVVMLDDPWFPKFASMGALEPLTPHYQKVGLSGPDADFVPTSAALGREPYGTGEVFALPVVGNCQMFFYRKDLLDAAKLRAPVRTWQEVMDYSRKLMKSGQAPFGYVIRGEKGNPIVVESMPIFWAFGAKMFDGDKVTIDTPQARKALQFLVDLKEVSPPGVENFNADQVANHLLQNKAAMAISWPAWISAMEDPAQSQVVGKMGYSAMPGADKPGESVIGNWLLAVPKTSANKDLAFDFIKWVTDADQQRQNAAEQGNPPTRVSIFKDPELLKTHPYYPAQLEALLHSSPRPRTSNWMEIENSYGIYLSQALSGVLTPAQALAQAQKEVSSIAKP